MYIHVHDYTLNYLTSPTPTYWKKNFEQINILLPPWNPFSSFLPSLSFFLPFPSFSFLPHFFPPYSFPPFLLPPPPLTKFRAENMYITVILINLTGISISHERTRKKLWWGVKGNREILSKDYCIYNVANLRCYILVCNDILAGQEPAFLRLKKNCLKVEITTEYTIETLCTLLYMV